MRAPLVQDLRAGVAAGGGSPGDRDSALACAGPWGGLRRGLQLAVGSAGVAGGGGDDLQQAKTAAVVEVADSFLREAASEGVPLEEADVAALNEAGGRACLLGRVSLRLATLLRDAGSLSAPGSSDLLFGDWHALAELGWGAVIRSGWPVLQLLRDLQGGLARASGEPANGETRAAVVCSAWAEDPYAVALADWPDRQGPAGLAARSLEYLATTGAEACPLTVAAAIVSISLQRLPVFDAESDALLKVASRQVDFEDMFFIIMASAHPLLRIMSRVAAAFQLSFGVEQSAILSEHVDDDCIVRISRTPRGQCNPFAPIQRDLQVWSARGIHLEDVTRAFQPVADQKTILFRLIDDELILIIPQHSHLEAEFGATEPTCLAGAILSLLSKVNLANFDLVLNHGDLPVLRKYADHPPFYGPTDKDSRIPAPLFSICASDDFWDILFPNVCRPALVNMSAMPSVPWEQKAREGFWRGTDRGAVNWAVELRDIGGLTCRGSPSGAWGHG
ncbi:unnamed protein product [Prorocentrum cordatum]|uniref:Glycosyl transferase CAP10 domain-containing protein n=1 Tax=Prorocentrum cordatum TaxID=2364126 RepID=A0ABN9QZE1_9DINO|nr:unnamed protein product [Polarella glacialis]